MRSLRDASCVHLSAIPLLSPKKKFAVAGRMKRAGWPEIDWGERDVVVKITKDCRYVTFLHYPGFFDVSHPSLRAAIIVSADRSRKRIDYSRQDNPFILHRKELLIGPANGDAHKKFCRLTAQELEAGLLDDPRRIKRRKQWEELLRSKGYTVVRHNLVRL